MVQTEFVVNGEQGNDSLVRFPRTSRHFVTTSDSAPHKETTVICSHCGDVSTIFLECGDRTCFECQKRRKHRILKRYHPFIAAMAAPKFLTLTLVRCDLTRDAVKNLRDYFTKLRHQNVWTAEGGIYQIEIGEIIDGTANLHLHAIIDSPVMTKKALRRAWHKITGDSYIIDIKSCWSPRGALQYLTEHMGKRIGDFKDAILINKVLKGTRMIQGFGYLSDMDLSMKDIICLKCGGKNTLYLDFEVLSYRYPAKVTGF